MIRWVLSLAVLSVWAAFIGTALYVAIYEVPDEIGEAQAIVVLGGGGDGAGGMGRDTAERLATGVKLYEEGKAPLLVMTGGGEPTIVADAMAAAARDAGVPDDAILVERASHSTLQNALFTGDLTAIDKEAPVIIVTQRYHLPRAWASFRWAGFREVIKVAADPESGFVLDRELALEGVKWPLNVVRALAASAAMTGDVPRESYVKYLE